VEIEFECLGLASTHEGWGPQIKGLTGTNVPNDEDDAVWSGEGDNEAGGGIEVCAFDNRGVGRSSVPIRKSDYSYVLPPFSFPCYKNEVIDALNIKCESYEVPMI